MTSNVNVCDAPFNRLNPFHVITPAAAVPPLLIFVGLEYPFGNKSSTDIPVASAGPAFVISIENVITSPTFGSASLTNLIKLKSETCLKPKSIVISPLSSSIASSLSPLEPGSFVGSVSGVKLKIVDVITPSVNPSPSVSCCDPLSSPST